MFNDWWNEIIFDDKKINLPDKDNYTLTNKSKSKITYRKIDPLKRNLPPQTTNNKMT